MAIFGTQERYAAQTLPATQPLLHVLRRHQHDGHCLFVDRLDDCVGFGGHDREQRVVADVGHFFGANQPGPSHTKWPRNRFARSFGLSSCTLWLASAMICKRPLGNARANASAFSSVSTALPPPFTINTGQDIVRASPASSDSLPRMCSKSAGRRRSIFQATPAGIVLRLRWKRYWILSRSALRLEAIALSTSCSTLCPDRTWSKNWRIGAVDSKFTFGPTSMNARVLRRP
ncbi:MAG: hypothetical protein QOE49_1768, partial [Rhodospirillaceae bacterium]|nr:hypothetical protein [Rhodospirillaceae bacterium]